MKVYIIVSGLDYGYTVDDAGIEAVFTNKKKAEKECEILKKENKYRNYWVENWETVK